MPIFDFRLFKRLNYIHFILDSGGFFIDLKIMELF